MFVRCVANLTNDLKKTGIITGEEKGAIQSVAASANAKLGNPKYGGWFYGNWGGPDWSGGKTGSGGDGDPVDDLDRQCRIHDNGYAAADAYWQPRYTKAKTAKARKQACGSWFSVYRSVDVALTKAARGLPSLVGTIRPTRPDAWNYDPRVFGPHPRSAGERNDY